ncbi:hypothetical protein IIC65_09020 [Candidatus Sumerlaeota bacterium]|nr:hypothetical protein [Candidatus Sumerlaeota bacterium]
MIRAKSMVLLMGFGLSLGSCSDETGKYVSGPDDPSLSVDEEAFASVNKALDRQEEKDIASGIRAEPSEVSPFSPAQPPALQSAPAGSSGTEQVPEATTSGGSGEKVLDFGIAFAVVPDAWEIELPSSTMRLAQLRIPASEGDAPSGAEVTVTQAGGGVEANLNRWYGQMRQPDGRPSSMVAKVEKLSAGSMAVTFVDIPGTFAPGAMPGRPALSPQSNWRMLGAIIEAPGGLLFVKATGPDRTMRDNLEKMKRFVISIRMK